MGFMDELKEDLETDKAFVFSVDDEKLHSLLEDLKGICRDFLNYGSEEVIPKKVGTIKQCSKYNDGGIIEFKLPNKEKGKVKLKIDTNWDEIYLGVDDDVSIEDLYGTPDSIFAKTFEDLGIENYNKVPCISVHYNVNCPSNWDGERIYEERIRRKISKRE